MTEPETEPYWRLDAINEDTHERVVQALLADMAERRDATVGELWADPQIRVEIQRTAKAVIDAYRGGSTVEDYVPDFQVYCRRKAVTEAIGRLLASSLPRAVYEQADMGWLEHALSVAAEKVYEPVIAGTTKPAGPWADTEAVERLGQRLDARAEARRADPHAHACPSCSPDGVTVGSGCHNCRQTGMDQTPCRVDGHEAQCPHGCCGGPRTSREVTNAG